MSHLKALYKTITFIQKHPLNNKTKGGLSRFLRFQLGSRLLPYGNILPFVGETRLLVKRGMAGATGNYYCGLHEFQEMGFLLHLLRDSDVFADVGANIGSYTILAAGVCGARTCSFEPCLSTHSRLCDNIRLNDLSARVQAFNMAVGAARGSLTFTVTCDTMNHVVVDSGKEKGVSVPVETLDVLMKDDIPCLLKIDVEGFETEVIKGAGMILASDSCKAVIMEVGGGSRYGFDEKALHQKLCSYGFEPCVYEPFSRNLASQGNSAMNNVLFVKDKEWARSRLRGAPTRRINGVEI